MEGQTWLTVKGTHFGFILNGAHTITECEDHVYRPRKLNYWCMNGVRLNPLCAPLIAYINCPISVINKKRRENRREIHRKSVQEHRERMNTEFRER
jgi:hypothetical protein